MSNYSEGMDIDLADYRAEHDQNKSKLKDAAKPPKKPATRSIEDIPDLNMNWSTYLSSVRAGKGHTLHERLSLLAKARQAFKDDGSLAQMDFQQAQGVAGIRGFVNGDRDIDWRWFGNMHTSFRFMKLFGKNVGAFSEALDAIPLNGKVTRNHYLHYIKAFRKPFKLDDGSFWGDGIAAFTRLLTMKRPDYFVPINNSNNSGLYDAFDVRLKPHDYIAYWDEIVERIKLARWWNAPRPQGAEAGRVWDGRAAMLDSIYYFQE